ncbi:MAG: 16S rRNA (cytosine(1402)-N(4))-methyltransferase RsmH [Candidatus Pacebacteria bacterium]|nr:16S rRNA (cytosine(1402)-N(4))-methyltransferase RsmH [Candidatus Paceibacterota bacterium]MDD3919058.1 16S rRNA (cytosine(1402)-N(4))-methyltransferase RsmH [Candidatus Paceibacterota bacterium]
MHIPVLPKEVLRGLSPKSNENFIDGTFHLGGHSELILKEIKPEGKILGIEIDEDIFKEAKEKFKGNDKVILVNDSYVNLEKIVEQNDFKNISGILLDVGMSSWHIDESKRGFTFQKDEPLNMLFQKEGLTAEEIVNTYSKEELERIFKDYGEEKKYRKIAEAILKTRKEKPIKTTFELISVLAQSRQSLPRIFQALRIEANGELDNLRKTLPQALKILKSGGRLAVISFHSGEDRIVKQFIKENKESLEILNKKPIVPELGEIRQNSRARSAKLRIIIKK